MSHCTSSPCIPLRVFRKRQTNGFRRLNIASRLIRLDAHPSPAVSAHKLGTTDCDMLGRIAAYLAATPCGLHLHSQVGEGCGARAAWAIVTIQVWFDIGERLLAVRTSHVRDKERAVPFIFSVSAQELGVAGSQSRCLSRQMPTQP